MDVLEPVATARLILRPGRVHSSIATDGWIVKGFSEGMRTEIQEVAASLNLAELLYFTSSR